MTTRGRQAPGKQTPHQGVLGAGGRHTLLKAAALLVITASTATACASIPVGHPDAASPPAAIHRVAPHVADGITAPEACQATELAAVIEAGSAAGNTVDFSLRVQNQSSQPCRLVALTGMRVVSGRHTVQPPWTQTRGTVHVRPRESATTQLTYRPSAVPTSEQQAIDVLLPTGDLQVAVSPALPTAPLAVASDVPVTASAWERTGFGRRLSDDEAPTISPADEIPACTNNELAATTITVEGTSADQTVTPERAYRVINIGILPCRLGDGDAEAITGVRAHVPKMVLTPPGFAADLAVPTKEHLRGTLRMDDRAVPVSSP